MRRRTRQQLHARVAQVLNDRFPERVAAEPEAIAVVERWQ